MAGTRGVRIMLEKVADSARKAVKLAEPYKPYGGQFLEFCSISLSTYQTCMKLTRKSTEFCQCFCRHYPHMPSRDQSKSASAGPRRVNFLENTTSVDSLHVQQKQDLALVNGNISLNSRPLQNDV